MAAQQPLLKRLGRNTLGQQPLRQPGFGVNPSEMDQLNRGAKREGASGAQLAARPFCFWWKTTQACQDDGSLTNSLKLFVSVRIF